jgi:alanyl-tRNA synthetase
MTKRLYYTDASVSSFDAAVVAVDRVDGRLHVVIDATAFYPTSGGQPFDTGTLGGVRVVDVIDRDDGSIAHVMDGPEFPSWFAVGASVHGGIDWPRRFDHMQQHTGQHVLSAAFDTLFGVRTVSFHLGADDATIDLAREVTAAEIAAAEAEANRVVWEDRSVTVRFVSEEEAARLPLRKDPARTGMLRLVGIDRCDLSACGGTHVPTTGVIGMIAVSGWERSKGASRIAFVCGGRALASHRRLRDIISTSMRHVSVAADGVPDAIARLQADNKTHQRAIKLMQSELAGHHAGELRAAAEVLGSVKAVLSARPGSDATAIKSLAAAIVTAPGFVVVLVGDGDPAPVVAARSADESFDSGAWMKAVTAALGGRGGGRSEMAQGGVAASAQSILSHARQALEGM